MRTGFKSVIEALERERAELDRVLAYLRRRADPEVEEAPDGDPGTPLAEPVPLRFHIEPGALSGRNIVSAILFVLREVGSPMTVPDIALYLLAGGLPYSGTDLEQDVLKTLHRFPEIFSEVDAGLWVYPECYP